MQEELIIRLTFNPGLALAGFRTTRLCSLTTTIVSLSTLTAACKGVSPRSSRHLTSAPDLSSNSTILTCLPRIALCSGVLPNESGEFTSGEEREVKHIRRIWSNLNRFCF